MFRLFDNIEKFLLFYRPKNFQSYKNRNKMLKVNFMQKTIFLKNKIIEGNKKTKTFRSLLKNKNIFYHSASHRQDDFSSA